MAEHLYTYIDPPNEKHLEKISKLLENDGVLVLPMGTNWAFACSASSHKALDKIRSLKPKHIKERPFSLVCADMAMASSVGNIDNHLYRYLKKAWPGPFTVIVDRNRTLPKQIKDKRPVVGIRIPNEKITLEIINYFGKPLAVSSLPVEDGQAPLKMGYEIEDQFGHAVDLIVDMGEELSGEESTVIDATDGSIEIVRQGAGDVNLFGI